MTPCDGCVNGPGNWVADIGAWLCRDHEVEVRRLMDTREDDDRWQVYCEH
jgi:hypothetical protein